MREDTSYCNSCNRLITFVRTADGHWMPCDASMKDFQEDEGGPDLAYLDHRMTSHGYWLTGPSDGSVKAWRPHWGSCARPSPHRKPRQPKKNTQKPPAHQPAPAAPKAAPKPAKPPSPYEQIALTFPEDEVRRLKDVYEAYC